MTTLGDNPRYANYARAHGRTPDAQLAHDKEAWKGGCMVGFILWNRDRLREASREIPDAFFLGNLSDHDAYDAWLTAWVDAILEGGTPTPTPTKEPHP